MLRFFQKIRSLQSVPVLLGRWCRTDKRLNDVKVDLANIDHCGTCLHEKVKDKPVLISAGNPPVKLISSGNSHSIKR